MSLSEQLEENPKRRKRRKIVSDQVSSTSSQLSTTSIEQIVEQLKLQKHRCSTRKNYYAVWKLFNKFFIRLDRKPKSWGKRLILFIGYLIQNKKQSSTVKSYISTIRTVLKDNNIKLNEDQFLITSLTKACRLVNDRVKTRLPVQRPMLEIMLRHMRSYYNKKGQTYLRILYTAIFCTMYYGLFRIGELTSGDHPVLARDVHLGKNKKKLLFVLRTSKTLYKNMKPQLVKITSTKMRKKPGTKPSFPSHISQKKFNSRELPCPYQALKAYLKQRGTTYSNPSEPFFVFRDKSPVQPKHVRNCFKLMLKLAKFRHKHLYKVHGIRAGRSCDLLKLGLSVEEIQRIGRWKSHAVYRYLM